MSSHADWVHCPRCAGDLRRGPVEGAERLHCPACGLVVYENPAPTATAIVIGQAGEIMLTRRAIEPFLGMWDLPGGFIHINEDPVDAVRRELLEETGLEIEVTGYLGTFPDSYGDAGFTLNLYYTAVVRSGTPVAADDVSEIGWFAPDALPPSDQIAFRNGVQALELYLRGRL